MKGTPVQFVVTFMTPQREIPKMALSPGLLLKTFLIPGHARYAGLPKEAYS
jgi:hypothetical protein